MTTGAGTGHVSGQWMDVGRRRCLMARHAVPPRIVVILVTACAGLARHRHGGRARMTARARHGFVLAVLEREGARVVAAHQRHGHALRIGNAPATRRFVTTTAGLGRCLAVMTAIAIPRRGDRHAPVGRSHVVAFAAFERAVLRMTEGPALLRPLLPRHRHIRVLTARRGPGRARSRTAAGVYDERSAILQRPCRPGCARRRQRQQRHGESRQYDGYERERRDTARTLSPTCARLSRCGRGMTWT